MTTTSNTFAHEDAEVSAYKQGVVEALSTFSHLATISIAERQPLCRTKYNLMRQLCDLPIITQEETSSSEEEQPTQTQKSAIEDQSSGDDSDEELHEAIRRDDSEDDADYGTYELRHEEEEEEIDEHDIGMDFDY
eukprot:GEZU01040245.1.p2 GENE.GEZU01040245.1~~GEZU01040245.1.p2  ORF type:complete len:135 (+),score=37.89 GEZU01040245.1:70-474(+)